MKKIFFCLVMALMAVCANAQVTWNVRVGTGISRIMYDEEFDWAETYHTPTLTVETNIPIIEGSLLTFSPSISIIYGKKRHGDLIEAYGAILPLHLGYKKFIGPNALFAPKVGLMMGYTRADGRENWDEKKINNFMLGPSIEFPFEIKHIVVALNANMSITEYFYNASLTVGYKF